MPWSVSQSKKTPGSKSLRVSSLARRHVQQRAEVAGVGGLFLGLLLEGLGLGHRGERGGEAERFLAAERAAVEVAILLADAHSRELSAPLP